MKRLTAGLVAVATALTLSVGPATAAESKSSSEVTDSELLGYVLGSLLTEKAVPGKGITSSQKHLPEKDNHGNKIDYSGLASSYRNDAANGYKLGTTFDILIGTTAGVLALAALGQAAVQAGLIQLPR